MQSAPGIGSVIGRIESISTRFGQPSTSPSLVVDNHAFDPFGDVYQQALASTFQAAATPSFTSVTSAASGSAERTGRFAESYAVRTVNSSPSSSGVSRTAIGGGMGTSGASSIGGYGRIEVPPELAVLGNGQLPADSLTQLADSGHRLYAPAAASWNQVVAAARADGLDLRITDSYRSYDDQVDLASRKGLYQNGGLAAVPGTSNHGWGLAVDADVRDPAVMAWLRTNGPRFGWVEPVPREPWHWEFRPTQV
jgi:hypothetical protein